jgi:hypothetical protein
MEVGLGGSTNNHQLIFLRECELAYHENITKRLEIISTRLLNTQMSIDRSVPSGTSQVLVLPVWDM